MSFEELELRATQIFDNAWNLREQKINANIDMSSMFGIDSKKLKELLHNELAEAISFYRSPLCDIIQYEKEKKQGGWDRSSNDYIELFEKADDFDYTISTTYTNRQGMGGYACLEELALAVEGKLNNSKK